MRQALFVPLTIAIACAPAPARAAEPLEVETDVVLREQPGDRARVVQRVSAGARVVFVARSGDGSYVRVRVGHRKGWAPRGFFKGMPGEATPPVEPRPVTSAAPSPPPQPDRPQAWVPRSLYHVDAPPPAEAAPADAELVKTVAPPEPRHAIAITAGVGVAGINRRFVTNGTGPVANYEVAATAVTAQAGLRWARGFRRLGLFALDASYVYAGGARVRYRDASTSAVMSLSQHQASAGLTLGIHSDVGGGIDAWLRGGADFTLTIIDPNVQARLVSDRLIAPTVAIGFDVPRLGAPRGHPIGLHLDARGIFDGQITENLSDGTSHGTWGAIFGGSLSLGLWRRQRSEVELVLAYSYGVLITRFTGASDRDPTATQSTLGWAQHLGTLALAYAY